MNGIKEPFQWKTPDDYSSGDPLLFIIIFFQVITIAMYLLLTNIHRIDRKKAANQSKEILQKMGLAVAVLFRAIAVITVYSPALHLSKVMVRC
jgi:hypothetical protein